MIFDEKRDDAFLRKCFLSRVPRCYSLKRKLITHFFKFRYAIGNVERPILKHRIGWLDSLANDIHEPYHANNTGGPSIKVRKIKI